MRFVDHASTRLCQRSLDDLDPVDIYRRVIVRGVLALPRGRIGDGGTAVRWQRIGYHQIQLWATDPHEV